MDNEPPIVRPPITQPIIQDNPYSAPIVVNTTKTTLYAKKPRSDAWAWKTIVVALLLSPVIWFISGTAIGAYKLAAIAKDTGLASIDAKLAMLAAQDYYEKINGPAETFGQSVMLTIGLECLICIPLGIYWVVRR